MRKCTAPLRVVDNAPVRDDKWVHNLCVEWANWARCAEIGLVSLSEGYMRERLDKAHDTEPSQLVALADKAIARMFVKRPDYGRVFKRYYLNPTELSEYEIGLQVGHNEARVKAMLRQSRFLVGYYLTELGASVE